MRNRLYRIINVAGIIKLVIGVILIGWLPYAVSEEILNATPRPNNVWSRVKQPLPQPPQVIGGYAAGCLAGGQALPLNGEGYQVVRPSRNRYYGHPDLIAFIKRLGRQVQARGFNLVVGDLSQPRGGPMSYGHKSHQSGLDVDIWFATVDRQLNDQEVETHAAHSVVDIRSGQLNAAHWSGAYRDMLQLTATDPAVERIFVNAIIKQALCKQEAGSAWLAKLRPWWGHDAHFHVRLRCPTTGSPQCKAQNPPPAVDGCTADLANWVRDIQGIARRPAPAPAPAPAKPAVTPKPATLPRACQAVLQADRSPTGG